MKQKQKNKLEIDGVGKAQGLVAVIMLAIISVISVVKKMPFFALFFL